MADGVEGYAAVAHLTRARGIRGELIGESLTSHPERFSSLTRVLLTKDGSPSRELDVEGVWDFRGAPVFKFRGIDSMNDAELLKGYDVNVHESERVALEPDEYFLSDLEGCEIVTMAGGRIGVVSGSFENGPQAVLEVTVEGRAQPVMIPFVKAFFPVIDVGAKKLVAELPEGLLELN